MALSEMEKSKRALARDYQKLVKDTEQLLGALGGELDDKTAKAKAKLEDSLEEYKDKLGLVEDRIHEEVQKTDALVREYPYHTAGLALGVGFLLGLVLKNRA